MLDVAVHLPLASVKSSVQFWKRKGLRGHIEDSLSQHEIIMPCLKGHERESATLSTVSSTVGTSVPEEPTVGNRGPCRLDSGHRASGKLGLATLRLVRRRDPDWEIVVGLTMRVVEAVVDR